LEAPNAKEDGVRAGLKTAFNSKTNGTVLRVLLYVDDYFLLNLGAQEANVHSFHN
jgi:hypothetical protein